MVAIPSETFDWIDTPLGMRGIQHVSQHVDRTESACIRWILAIGFATMMGPWLHHFAGCQASTSTFAAICRWPRFPPAWKEIKPILHWRPVLCKVGSSRGSGKKNEALCFFQKHVFFSAVLFFCRKPLTLHFGRQVAQMLELYRHILRDCHVPSLLLVGCPISFKIPFW